MKTVFLSSIAVVGLLIQVPHVLTASHSDETQLFLAAPQIAVYALDQ
ncbi:hypothetical protein AAFO92_04630 [Roseovarius sp. CAU 1744]